MIYQTQYNCVHIYVHVLYIYVASRYINGPWSLLHRTYIAEYWYLGVKQYNIMAFRKMSVLYVYSVVRIVTRKWKTTKITSRKIRA